MNITFPDRRARLFGREPHINWLLDRANEAGLTAVVARPLMGKTWSLVEVARRLHEEGKHLVGYHESQGCEKSHLLYAVSSLYTCWLSDSSLRQQALSLWKRHKENLVPRIGQLAGSLFEKLTKPYSESVSALVRVTFDGLAEAQKDLLTAGVPIAPLPYDQALSLTRLVAEVSGRQIALILDAWDKSPSMTSEYVTLEGFLRHLDEWPTTHLFLAIDHPRIDSNAVDGEAHRKAGDLRKLSPAASLYELPAMELDNPNERQRLISYVRQEVAASAGASDERLIEMVDGFPGVVRFWTEKATQRAMKTEVDLDHQAANAQQLKYLDLDRQMENLGGDHQIFAARLSFLPELDQETWATFQHILLKDMRASVVDDMIDRGLLTDLDYPAFGHPTRHAAARKWFTQNKHRYYIRIAGDVLASLALRAFAGSNYLYPQNAFFDALLGLSGGASQDGLDPSICCVVEAARTLNFGFDLMGSLLDPKFDQSCTNIVQQNASWSPLVFALLCHRADYKEALNDLDGALKDYRIAIELPGISPRRGAEVLLGTAVRTFDRGHYQAALAYYEAVIELHEVPSDFLLLAQKGVARATTHNLRDKRD